MLYSTGSLLDLNIEHSVARNSILTWTSFVNRCKEVVELAVYNAHFIKRVRDEGANVSIKFQLF